jgi:hypothetical protein
MNPQHGGMRCTWNGEVIFDGCSDEADPAAGEPLGFYEGAFCEFGTFILTEDIDRAAALDNCLLNDSQNPGYGVRCTWNGEVIYDGCEGRLAPPAEVPSAPSACVDWEKAAFDRAPEVIDESFWSADEMRCDGPSFRRFDERYGLWVGLVSCGTGYRFYLSESQEGPYLPAADGGGHGQDLCELVDPLFTIPIDDDIRSGGCTSCSTSVNHSFVGGEVFVRYGIGGAFTRTDALGWGGYQSSVITCGSGPIECGAAAE